MLAKISKYSIIKDIGYLLHKETLSFCKVHELDIFVIPFFSIIS